MVSRRTRTTVTVALKPRGATPLRRLEKTPRSASTSELVVSSSLTSKPTSSLKPTSNETSDVGRSSGGAVGGGASGRGSQRSHAASET